MSIIQLSYRASYVNFIIFYPIIISSLEFFHGTDFPLDTNPAYVDHKSLAQQIKECKDIAVKKNEAYMEIITDTRSDHIDYVDELKR